MELHQLIRAVPGAAVPPAADGLDISALVRHAGEAVPGCLFVAVPGVSADGHDYAPQAVAGGAAALVVERPLPDLGVPQVVVPDARLALALMADLWEHHPSHALAVVGVTGTNGKTTCAILCAAVLAAAGRPAGLIGTIETRVGGVPTTASHTTPDALDLQHLFRRMLTAGDTACAMEVSSHALHQRRVAGVRFAAALFTNLTQDHLDYHGEMEPYYAAKRMLFVRPAEDGPAPPAAVNLDDPYGRRLAAECEGLGYGIDAPDAAVRPRAVAGLDTGIRATVVTPRGELELASPLRGRFNLSNLLGAVAVGELLGLDHADVARGLAGVTGVPGRFEPVDAGQPFPVIVDYAHTPDSLENILSTARELVDGGRLIVAVGCGGDRDRRKRPLMGAVAGRLADVAVITSDNPRSEDPEAIIAEILGGMDGVPARVVVEPDRRAAIAAAVSGAGPGDVVVVAGKGHEQGQERAGVITPFDDRVVAREIIAGLAGASADGGRQA